ncbi:uncharacterized protein LOC115047913 isoform X2 [Echeneis naucrates]|nr:uncharacterized protein LOC115047913 isoform X2 [Echeneis naucrates]
MLYQFREKVDSIELQSGAEEAQFTVRVQEENLGQLFCCLYKDQEGRYSAFSPYLQLETQKDAAPTRSMPSFPPPVLTVKPSTGVVKPGDMLSFNCSVPAPPSQSRFQSGHTNKPMTFLLLKAGEQTGETSAVLQPLASQASSPQPQPGHFALGPVTRGEAGEYACIYQIVKKRRLVNSTLSNVVQVSVTDALPPATLVLQQQTDAWHLLCTGSPAYTGAVFSLYLADSEVPIATQRAKMIHHQSAFPVPVQEALMVSYQCQYSVLLGKNWAHSERSRPLTVTRGTSAPSSPDLSDVDWPLILGSFSAVVLLLCSVALVVVVAHRRVKAAAEKRKKRQDAQFWTQVHAKDHIVDLTLRHSGFTSQEWADGETETASRSQMWNSLSTFTTPIH